ncbi:hypothetical protein Tco_0122987 [Tanacetum coccineum]
MAETMEQYMSKTRDEYGSSIARPKIDANAQFELKGQFLKELHDNTFSGLKHEDANEHIKKCPQYYLTDMHEVILFYNGLDVPTRQILDSRGAIPTKTVANAKVAIQEMAEYYQKWHNGTSSKNRSVKTSDGLTAIQAQLNSLGQEIKKLNKKVAVGLGFYQCNNGNSSYPAQKDTMEESLSKFMAESAKRHEEKSNIIKEIRASTDAAIRNQGASIKTLELQIGQMSKVLQERGFGSLPCSTETDPRDQVKLISTTTGDLSEIRHMEYGPYAARGVKILEAYDHDLPQKEKDLRDQVKLISTTTGDLSEIRHMEYGPYAVSVSHHNVFPETVP